MLGMGSMMLLWVAIGHNRQHQAWRWRL